MRRIAVGLLLVACSSAIRGPDRNELVQKQGRKIILRAPVATATFCKTCGRDAPVVVRFADKIELSIPNCYAHAQSKIGDHDKVKVELLDTHADATAGELDITDCVTSHVTAKLWVTFPDGTRADAVIDTDVKEP